MNRIIPLLVCIACFLSSCAIIGKTSEKTECATTYRIDQRTDRPLLAAEQPWEDFYLGWVSVIRDGDRWRMWYSCSDHRYRDDNDGYLCYAESEDGILWKRPSLGMVEYQGSRDNNIILSSSAIGGFQGQSIFVDPQAPASERFKMVFIRMSREPKIPEWWVYGATSPDGMHWEMIENPLLKKNSDTQVVCLRVDDGYRLYVRMWSGQEVYTGKRIVGLSESPVFGDFSDPVPVLAPDSQDPPDMDFYNPAIARLEDGLYLMFPSGFYSDSGKVIPHLALSADGVHFTRPARQPFVPLGKEFDDTTIYIAPGVVPADEPGAYWIYYTGSRVKHDDYLPARAGFIGGIGRLRLIAPGSCQD